MTHTYESHASFPVASLLAIALLAGVLPAPSAAQTPPQYNMRYCCTEAPASDTVCPRLLTNRCEVGPCVGRPGSPFYNQVYPCPKWTIANCCGPLKAEPACAQLVTNACGTGVCTGLATGILRGQTYQCPAAPAKPQFGVGFRFEGGQWRYAFDYAVVEGQTQGSIQMDDDINFRTRESFVATTSMIMEGCITRYFRYQVTNAVGASPWSDVVTVPCDCRVKPAAPTGLAVRFIDGRTCQQGYEVTWTPPPSPNCPLTYYVNNTGVNASGPSYRFPWRQPSVVDASVQAESPYGRSAWSERLSINCACSKHGEACTKWEDCCATGGRACNAGKCSIQ